MQQRCQISFSWASKSRRTVPAAMKLRHLLLERIAMTNLDSILKSRDITLPAKVHLVKAMVFPVVMHRCESWTIKKAEHCFWTVALGKTLESPLDSKIKPVSPKGNQSWSWSPSILATWCKEPTHWKRPWCWRRLRAGGEGNRQWDGWMASSTQWTWVWANSGR